MDKYDVSGGISVQEIEIEYKVLLTKEQYEKLETAFPFPKIPFKQVNHYFETDTFALKSHRSALRIREKEGKYTLTLKEVQTEGILETHDKLTEEEFRSWINGQVIPKENTSKRLRKLSVDLSKLKYFGSLTTERKTFSEGNIHYFLDKSFYHDKVDYELEIEAPNKEIGLKVFQSILEQYEIERKKPITKIERFFTALMNNNS